MPQETGRGGRCRGAADTFLTHDLGRRVTVSSVAVVVAFALLVAASLWVYVDARALAARGASVLPLESALGCLIFFIVYLPRYLARRPGYVREATGEVQPD